MLRISQLYIYPIKSLGGIALNSARLTDRGLEHDRRWMLIDENNRFLSQRENAQMALFKTDLESDALKVTYSADNSFIYIPFTPLKQDTVQVTIWDDTCTGQYVSDEAGCMVYPKSWASIAGWFTWLMIRTAQPTHDIQPKEPLPLLPMPIPCY
jgi:uncharacterized protein YcbX